MNLCSYKTRQQTPFYWVNQKSQWLGPIQYIDYLVIIKSKLLVLGAVNTAINDQGCQHVTGRFEPIRMLLSKQTGRPTFFQSHPSVKTVE